MLSQAVKARLPTVLEPPLATLATTPPKGLGWAVETKLDGYRIMARVESGTAGLLTRRGHDWTDMMNSLAAAIQTLGIKDGCRNCQIVVLTAQRSSLAR